VATVEVLFGYLEQVQFYPMAAQ